MTPKFAFPVFVAVFAVVGISLGSLMPGGRMDVDVNDPGVQNAVNFAVVQHNRGTNDMYLHQAAEVVKAQRQVVAGMKYIITVKMAKTNCRKDRPNEVCAIHENPENAQVGILLSYLKPLLQQKTPWNLFHYFNIIE
ncbi:cystatin C (amyloid angiopathy and cerebral hemorrhage) isoform X1 [Sphaeramia orbicularis]|uniref:cystatin C (amyloid angiopathy and cerebral hemorrhage) isoform X1 n=1 Tax=Sphaeramia orbicularis TaxID=375764 RepID=UPI00117E4A05|nr:cystatin-C-like isoform X1 [Sphaeramia orbicularis]